MLGGNMRKFIKISERDGHITYVAIDDIVSFSPTPEGVHEKTNIVLKSGHQILVQETVDYILAVANPIRSFF